MLISGSNAEATGLRNGDELLNTFLQESMQDDQQAVLELNVERGDQTLTLWYQPRGEDVMAYQWTAISEKSPSTPI